MREIGTYMNFTQIDFLEKAKWQTILQNELMKEIHHQDFKQDFKCTNNNLF